MKKNKKRVILVVTFLILFAIYLGVTLRGEYLRTLEIGQEYLSILKQNIEYRVAVVAINFVVLYIY